MTLLSDFFPGGGQYFWEDIWGITPYSTVDPDILVGNLSPISVTYTTSGINTGIPNSAADIDNPLESDWLDLIDISGEDVYQVGFSTVPIIRLVTADPAGTALRMQLTVNDIIVADIKIVSDGTARNLGGYIRTIETNSYRLNNTPVFIRNSLKLRACRSGTIGTSTTNIVTSGDFFYGAVKL